MRLHLIAPFRRSRSLGRALAAVLILAGAATALVSGSAAQDGDIITMHLIWSNDVHGHVAPEPAYFMNPAFPPPLGGGASAGAYVRRLRERIADDPDQFVLMVDAGDTWQGAPVGTLTEGQVMVAYYNAMGYDAVAIGNHEFDKGKQLAIELSQQMNQPFLACNLYLEGTEDIVDWVEPYRIVERAGLRIGIIGGITPGTEAASFEENVEGLDFGPLLPALEKQRDILIQQEQVDLVIAVVHEGLPFDPDAAWANITERVQAGEDIRENVYGAMELAHVLEGVPIMVGGHTHRGYREPWIDPVTHTMVFESFGNGSSLGHAMIKIHRGSGQVLGYDKPRRDGVLVTLFEDEWWPDDEMAGELKPYIEEAEKGLDEVVGRSSVDLTRSGKPSRMGMFITASMREALNADFAFTNNGGLRTDLSAGNITNGDLMRVLPFGNALTLVDMDGRTIRRIFERKGGRRSSGVSFDGVKVVVDPDADFGQRVLQLTIRDGEPIDPDKIYKAVTSDFLMDGNSGLDFLTEIPPDQVEYSGILTREAAALYLEKYSPVAPRSDGRWSEDPGGAMADYLQGWGTVAAQPASTTDKPSGW